MVKTISRQSSTNPNKAKHNQNNLKENQIQPGIQYNIEKLKGGNQPPKNKTTNKEDINIILEYSAKKNKAKVIEEYSTYSQKLILIQPQVNQRVIYWSRPICI